MGGFRRIVRSVDETIDFGIDLGRRLKTNSIVGITGDLGVGKTALIKGVASGFLGIDSAHVSSPTFNYMNIYENNNGLLFYHFDLYRVTIDVFYEMGLFEYLYAGVPVFIEWPEVIISKLGPDLVIIDGKILPSYEREFILSCNMRNSFNFD